MIYIIAGSFRVAEGYAKAVLPTQRKDWEYITNPFELYRHRKEVSVLILTWEWYEQRYAKELVAIAEQQQIPIIHHHH